MSWLSQVLGGVLGVGPDSPANIAAGQANSAANKQLDFFKNLFSDLQGQSKEAFDTGLGSTKNIYDTSTANLNNRMGAAQSRLFDLFSSQRGQFQSLLGDIKQSGRQAAAQRGLIGGAQEAALLTPAITRLGESFGTQAAQAQLGLEEMGLNLGTGLDTNYMGSIANLFNTRMSSLGSMAGGALSGVGGAGQTAITTAGQYDNPMTSILGGASIAKLFGII